MPVWFKEQLKRAYYQKDYSQILLLNQCWFFYWNRINTAQLTSLDREHS